MKILAVIVLYNPDCEDVYLNIMSYIQAIDKLIIWNNSDNIELKSFGKFSEKIIRMGSGKNMGLGYVYNQAAKYAMTNGYTHLMTMDQDSFFEKGSMLNYVTVVNDSEYLNTAIFSPNYKTIHGLSFPISNELTELEAAQSSGSIIPIDLYSKVGTFRSSFFIYGIDHAFCYEVRNKGGKVLAVHSVVLNHTPGNQRKKRKFLWKTVWPNEYSSMSTYYLIRNELILFSEYSEKKKVIFDFVYYYIFKRLIFIALYEDEKMKKMYAVFLGIIHGLLRKEGVYKNV